MVKEVVKDAVNWAPLVAIDVAIDATEDVDNVDDMGIGFFHIGLSCARAEAPTRRGHRHRQRGETSKFLDVCVSSSHGHSY
jgi:hypothetical protein